VPAVDQPLTLDDPVLGPLVVTAEGFHDRVLWNPGPGHGLGDVPAGAERDFTCIESAELTEVVIKPSDTWQGTQTLTSTAY
jgi:glucose-6-phosphate 1-epimerase